MIFMQETAAQRAHFKLYEREGLDATTLRNLADVVRLDIKRHRFTLTGFVEAGAADFAAALEDELAHAAVLLGCLERAASKS